MLTICDRGGRGKSTLLRRLIYNCKDEFSPPVAACMIELAHLNPSPFAFVLSVVEQLEAAKAGTRAKFENFAKIDDARAMRDFTVFGSEARMHAGIAINPEVTADHVGGDVIGLYMQSGSINVPARPDFTEEQEQRAQKRCVDAFFEDLPSVCETETIVVALDAWERCNLSMRDWIYATFLRGCLLHPDPDMRPAKLAVVVAGQPHVPGSTPFGLRDDEFARLFERQEDYEKCVLSRRSLSDWEPKHVREFMELIGYSMPDDEAVDFIQSRLRKGWSLEKVLTMIEKYLMQSQ